MKKLFLFAALFLALPFWAQGQDKFLFIADPANPQDYTLFANSGWDGAWAVQYNKCWIQKITVDVSSQSYQRAYIGARLGRSKADAATLSLTAAKPIAGAIYIALSSTFSWQKQDALLLTENKDIPLQGDANLALDGTAESQWFWQEVPLEKVCFNADNYIALWTPSETFIDPSSASILAGAWGSNQVNTWILDNTKGRLPSKIDFKTLQPITVFEPAIALKLVTSQANNLAIEITSIVQSGNRGKNKNCFIVWGSAQGRDINRAWVEVSSDGKQWTRYGLTQTQAPYSFTILLEDVIPIWGSQVQVRLGACDIYQNTVYSAAQSLFGR